MVFVAVEGWNKLAGAERALGVLLAVPVFILAGFEHCVADVFFFGAALGAGAPLEAKIVPFTIAATAGNTIGALLMWALSPKDKANA
jgi:nitrite transporter NirC